MSDGLARAARLFAEPARAAMLLRLMNGRALPAGELANAANISPQTASEHLARLADGGFVVAHQQGRHRYYGLAAPEVADAVEALLVLTTEARESLRKEASTPTPGSLQHARTCYAHLAGWLGVVIAQALQREGYLTPAAARAFVVTEAGRSWFEQHGVLVPPQAAAPDAKLARQCLDWTERRPHVAGKLGLAMYKQFLSLGWLEPVGKTRAVRVTLEGRRAFEKHLRLVIA